MAEREGKEDDRGGTAEVSIILIIYKSVLFRNEKEGEEFSLSPLLLFLPSWGLSLSFQPKIFPGCVKLTLSLSLSLSLLTKS